MDWFIRVEGQTDADGAQLSRERRALLRIPGDFMASTTKFYKEVWIPNSIPTSFVYFAMCNDILFCFQQLPKKRKARQAPR